MLRRVRYIPLSSQEAIVVFEPSLDPLQEVRLVLRPAGADRDPRSAEPVAIIEATMLGDIQVPLQVNDGQIAFTPESNERIAIRIVADGNLDGQAFRLT